MRKLPVSIKKNLNILRLTLVAFTALVVFNGCLSSALNYRPTAELQDEYRYTAMSEHFRAYYDVIPAENGRLVRGVLQNISRTYATNVTLDISESVSGGQYDDRAYLFKSLGSIKMLSHKSFEFLIIGKETKELVVRYDFLPSVEDSFISQRPDDKTGGVPMDVQPIRGVLKLPSVEQPN